MNTRETTTIQQIEKQPIHHATFDHTRNVEMQG